MAGQKQQTVLVTAGADGIGRSIAEKFLLAGARVHICDVDQKALSAVLDAHPELTGTLADIGEADAVRSLVQTAAAQMGGIDVLVNNAGIGGPRAAVEDIELDDWRRTIEVNLNGAFYCIREVTPIMKRMGGGVILNIITSSVKTGLPLRSPYVASKAGLIGLSDNLARELGPFNIRCNCISPGLIDNARGRRLVQTHARSTGLSEAEAEREFLKYVSMHCWIKPEEVGDMAVFLASDAARHVTGQHVAVDGNAEWEQ
jgi:NAD(P)-dependent dehydrogenase (short-subunit alcohol dehydrogenase family)